MYGAGAKPCTGACESQWQAAGKSIALSASTLPGLSPAEVSSASAASNWCADLMLNKFSQRLSASVESRLQANLPLDRPGDRLLGSRVRGRVPGGLAAAGQRDDRDRGVRCGAGRDDPGAARLSPRFTSRPSSRAPARS